MNPANDDARLRTMPALGAATERALIDSLTQVIRARAARALLRRTAYFNCRRDLRQDVDELTQEVFAALFANEAHALRSWDPTRGLSFRNFVGLIAERQISDILQSARRRPWLELMTVGVSEIDLTELSDPETSASSRELFQRLEACIAAKLSPRASCLFNLIFVEERSVEDVQSETGMNRNAIYAWRSRLSKAARRYAYELTQ